MATSAFLHYEETFQKIGWIFDSPFRTSPVLDNDESYKIQVFPRYPHCDFPDAKVLILWPMRSGIEGNLD